MQNLKDFDDHYLFSLLKQSNEKAFEVLYLRYWEKLLSVCYNWLGSEEIAKELIQDVFVSLWINRQKINIERSFKSYLFTSIKYRIFDHIDAEKVRSKFSAEAKKYSTDLDNSTEEKLSFEEVYALVEREVQNLPEKSRQVFELRREDHSVKEIAAALNISSKTVEYHISKANKQIRNNLEDLAVVLALIFFIL